MKVFSRNKAALHDYTIEDKIEVGIAFIGAEVKSVSSSNCNLKGSYVSIKDNEVFLIGCHISRPDYLDNRITFNEKRDIKLLLKKKEIQKLYSKVQEKGYTLVLLDFYQKENSKKIKGTLGIAKGNKEFDKRRILKEKELDRETSRIMKDYK